jgi:hypothetical protein
MSKREKIVKAMVTFWKKKPKVPVSALELGLNPKETQYARITFGRMKDIGLLKKVGNGRGSNRGKYVPTQSFSLSAATGRPYTTGKKNKKKNAASQSQSGSAVQHPEAPAPSDGLVSLELLQKLAADPEIKDALAVAKTKVAKILAEKLVVEVMKLAA